MHSDNYHPPQKRHTLSFRVLVFELVTGGVKSNSCDQRLNCGTCPLLSGTSILPLSTYIFARPFFSPPQLVPVINLIYGLWAD